VLGTIRKPLHYLQQLACTDHALAVHCNYLSNEEIRFLSENSQVAVVYCPRTHAYFQHAIHPWQKLWSAEATVVLGTDSRASNPDLSIWKELQFVASQPGVPPLWDLLPMITTTAARSVGKIASDYEVTEGTAWRGIAVNCSAHNETTLNAELLKNTVPYQLMRESA